MKKIIFSTFATVLLVSSLIALGFKYYYKPNMDLDLEFNAIVGSNTLILDEFLYQNPGGRGLFKVRVFRFFISNIRLVSDSGDYVKKDSYHLVRFDESFNSFHIMLTEIPKRNYTHIEFALGVDNKSNNSIIPSGDLDPNSRMAWSWEVGYKFILLEGSLQIKNMQIPLVYHIGFNENYRPLIFNLPITSRTNSALTFEVDIMKMFSHKSIIDMEEISTVKFDPNDARRLADNYESMIHLK